ncbi:hypothetical protein NQ273_29300, partial [Escherichia coli]|nr:hypothetical protein [Escherichia coli]
GHHCHGRKRLSGGRPQKFLPASGQKVLRDVHFTPGLAETVVAVYAALLQIVGGDKLIIPFC